MHEQAGDSAGTGSPFLCKKGESCYLSEGISSCRDLCRDKSPDTITENTPGRI